MSEVTIQELHTAAIFDGPSSNQIDQLAKALSSAQADMQAVPFDSKNPFFKSKYSSLGAVISSSKPALGKHGLSLLQKPTWVGDKLSMRTLLLHASGQWLDCGTLEAVVKPQGQLSPVQAAGSLVTYLRRYSRAAVCQLYSDEDTDGNGPPNDSEHSQTLPEPDNGPSREEYIPADPPPKTNQTRMKALNLLQAAPGQPQRDLVSRYLTAQKQLAVDGEPESWVLDYVPNTPRMLRELGAEIAKWEAEQQAGAK